MNKVELEIDLNTEKWSYIIGFWWADGGLRLSRKGGKLYKTFIFTNTDLQIINDIYSEIGIGAISSYQNKKNPHWAEYHRYRIYSDNLFDYAYSILNSTSKTYNNALPIIPHNMWHHFIRGFFDGDGTIYWASYTNRHGKLTKNLRSAFTASNQSEPFLQKLLTILGSVNINSHITRGNHNIKLALGQEATEKLCNWMYKDATIYMNRKYDIWKAASIELKDRKTRYKGNIYGSSGGT